MDEREHRAFLGLGGNLGDPRASMRQALEHIRLSGSVVLDAVSSLYRTPPWGKLDQPDFLNSVAAIRTTLTPQELLELCLSTERHMKRVRHGRWGPRLIDVDVLWFDGLTVTETGLELPHPRITERAFVLVPLAEIAPQLPLSGKPVADWLTGVDRSGISVAEQGDRWALA